MRVYIYILEVILVGIILFLTYIKKNVQKSQMKRIFIIDLIILFWICLFLVLQYWLNLYYHIPLIFFEYFMYIGTCFLPLSIFFTCLIFINTKIKFKKSYIWLFIIPIISLLVLWTNDLHHLFYKSYSLDLSNTIRGPYIMIHNIYSYVILFLGLFLLIRYSIRNAGFFSKQSIFFCIGFAVPLITNILGALNIIPMTIYITPISFAITIFSFAVAIFKFNFLRVTPIAMQRIVDRMSDSFLVVNEDGNISDFNNTFIKTFKLTATDVRNANFVHFASSKKLEGMDADFIHSILDKCKTTEETILVRREMKIKDKYFNIEASGIFSKSIFLGTLVLLKDVTQHVNDRNTIENNQNMLMEKERLASLGQMIGGIAHNLKTPIMSISGAAEGLRDLTKEYDISIGDPTVTNEDHHAIVKDMNEWIEKIQTHTSYMSDVITAVKGQTVTLINEKML